MATLIPSRGSCASRMTSGEERLATRLETKLEDDYLCWYDVPVGARGAHPDFVILHPRRGLLILEVKDWKLETIKDINKASATLMTPNGLKHVANPLEQARQYAFRVVELLSRDRALVAPEGHRHQGKLLCPYGYGVALTNITRRAFESTHLAEIIEPHRVICKDEMTESVAPDAFQERLWGMFTVHFAHVLTMPQVERIRWHLFPEIRVDQGLLPLEPAQDAVPDMIRVMDLQQEQLARSLGEGHRVIHGVAGSGKTMILGYRCVHLAKALAKPILVLCYNVALASKLEHAVKENNLRQQVSVRSFHSWCADQLRLYHVGKPAPGPHFFDELVQTVITAVDRGQIPRAQYGAVMIDEGHDFEPEWLKLVGQMVSPETNSLLILYDDAQSIYGKRRNRQFSFAGLGIQARGRTTILRLNYRNTAEILDIAYEFAKDVLPPEDADEDGVPLVRPQSAGRHGPMPLLVQVPTLRAEADFLVRRFRELHDEGHPWKDMAVVYRTHFIGEEITRTLRKAGIPVDWLNEDRSKRKYSPAIDSVKVVTMHSSKGLEFPIVAIPGIGYMPHSDQDPRQEARLLYVAMTRAMEHLIISFHRESDFAKKVSAARLRLAA